MVWWGPTAQFRRVQVVIAMAILLALGIWALRRLTLREYPDAAEQPATAPFEHALHGLRGDRAASSSQPPPDTS